MIDLTQFIMPIYCTHGQHYGIHIYGVPPGFCPVCKPFYDQFHEAR